MHLTRSARAMLLCLVLTAIVSSVVSAATTGPIATTTPKALTKTEWATTLAFPKFNPALGNLYQVDIFITATMNTVLTITNLASTPSSGMANTQLTLTVTDPLANFSMGPIFSSPNFTYNLNPGQQIVSGVLTKTGNDFQQFTAAAVLVEFTGAGSILLNASTYTETWLNNNGGNTAVAQSTDASATGTVTYWYDPVPEPAGLTLLGPAFLGLVTMIRRRK